MRQSGQPQGLFLSFEGVDGAGKSTQCSLVCQAFEQLGRSVLRLREPGGTQLGERIRQLLLDPDSLEPGTSMSPVAELLLYEAARAQLVQQKITPALAQGHVVVCDRFADSTVAYQGFARNLGADTARMLNGLSCGDLMPKRTLMLDMEPAAALDRAVESQGPDRMEREGLELQQRVRAGMLDCAARDPGRIRLIDAAGSVPEVYGRICQALADLAILPGYASLVATPHVQGS